MRHRFQKAKECSICRIFNRVVETFSSLEQLSLLATFESIRMGLPLLEKAISPRRPRRGAVERKPAFFSAARVTLRKAVWQTGTNPGTMELRRFALFLIGLFHDAQEKSCGLQNYQQSFCPFVLLHKWNSEQGSRLAAFQFALFLLLTSNLARF